MADRTSALKTLLTRLVDSREGYRDAVDHADSPSVKAALSDFVSRRDRDASELRIYLVGTGAEVDDDGSLLASAHRMFMDIKDSVTGTDDKATLQEVVRGETSLLGAYDDALNEAGATDPEYAFLTEQRASLKLAIAELEGRATRAA